MRRRILILLCCLPLFAQAQSVAPDGDYCGYSSAHRDLDSVCRTHADGGQYCEYDPYGRVCAYVTVLYNGEDRTYCMTCVDGSPTPPGHRAASEWLQLSRLWLLLRRLDRLYVADR